MVAPLLALNAVSSAAGAVGGGGGGKIEAILALSRLAAVLIFWAAAAVVFALLLKFPPRLPRVFHIASESGKDTVAQASRVFGEFCGEWSGEVEAWWAALAKAAGKRVARGRGERGGAAGSGEKAEAPGSFSFSFSAEAAEDALYRVTQAWFANGRASVLSPTYVSLNAGRPDTENPRPGSRPPKPKDENGAPFDPVVDVYDYPDRSVNARALMGACSTYDGSLDALDTKASAYPALDFLTRDELDKCMRAWAFRNPSDEGFDPVKVIGTDPNDVRDLRRVERFDLFLAVVPAFARHARRGHAFFQYVKYHHVPRAVEWVRASPAKSASASSASASSARVAKDSPAGDRPRWDPNADPTLSPTAEPADRRDICAGPWIALKLAFHRRQWSGLEAGAAWIESARDYVGKSLRSRVHEAVSNSSHLVQALLEVGSRGGGCLGGDSESGVVGGDFPGPDRLFAAVRANVGAYSRTAMAPVADAFFRWSMLESAATEMARDVRKAAQLSREGGEGPGLAAALLTDEALLAFTERSLSMFDDCMMSMSTAISSAHAAGEITGPAPADEERSRWNRMLDLITPDPGVELGYRSLEEFASGPAGAALAGMGETEAKAECKRRFAAYLRLLNAAAYAAGYVGKARGNVNRLHMSQEVAKKFWSVFFCDIARAYLSKTRPLGTEMVPHVSELGTVYDVESIAEYTIAFWSDFPKMMKDTRKFFSDMFQQTLSGCAGIFGWTKKASNELDDAGFAGAVHPTSYLLLVKEEDGKVGRLRLAPDGSVTRAYDTAEIEDPATKAKRQVPDPVRRSDHFILKELESNVFMLLSYDGLRRAWVSGTSKHQLKFSKNTNKMSEASARFQASLVGVDRALGKRIELSVLKRPGYKLEVWLRPLSLIRWLIDSDERGASTGPGGRRDVNAVPGLEKSWSDGVLCDGKTIGKFNVKRTRAECAAACAMDPDCKYAIQRKTRDATHATECRIKADCGKDPIKPDEAWNTWTKPAEGGDGSGVDGSGEGLASLEKSWSDGVLCDGKTIGKFNVKRTRVSCAAACAVDPDCKYAAQRTTKDANHETECRIKAECGKAGMKPEKGWNTWAKPT